MIQCVKGKEEDVVMRRSWGEGRHNRKTLYTIHKNKNEKEKRMSISLTANQNYSSVFIW